MINRFFTVERDGRQIGGAIGQLQRAKARAIETSRIGGSVAVIKRDGDWNMVKFHGVACQGEYTRLA